MFFLLWFATLGIAGGWSSGKLMVGGSRGPIIDIFMGLAGGVVIGMWTGSLGELGLWGFLYASVSALLGAALLTVVTAFINGREYA